MERILQLIETEFDFKRLRTPEKNTVVENHKIEQN